MNNCNFKPYEGNEPYIFISYAHRDSDLVFPILNQLSQRGYRIWYDDGIAPGSEWPENIAQHLNNCALTVAFVSDNSMNSPNCRREITFALSKKKPFLSVILQPTEMPLGMELQLSAQQCVTRYGYSDEAQFIDKICSCPDLAPCLVEPAEPEPVSAPAPAIPAPPVTEPPKAVTAKKEQKAKAKPLASVPKKAWIGIGAGVAAAILIVLLIILLPGKDSVKDLTSLGVEIPKDQTWVTITNQQIDTAAAEALRGADYLTDITFEECTFSANLEMPQLTSLTIRNCTGITDYTFINGMRELAYLEISGSGLTDSSLPSLLLPNLCSVDLSNNSEFTALDKLTECTALMSVTIDSTGVSDVAPLANHSALYEISANNNNITSIDALAPLTELNALFFDACQITTVTEPFKSLRMEELHFDGNGLTDVSGFDNLTVLNTVDFGGNELTSAACIDKSCETLQDLDISGAATSLIYSLENCVNLIALRVDGCFIYECDIFAGMSDLVMLSAENCDIAYLDGLENCRDLMTLNLVNNHISDVSPLSALTSEYGLYIDLSLNSIEDASSLPRGRYETLSLLGNDTDVRTLTGLNGNVILLDYNETITEENVPSDLLFSEVYIASCPDDQKVAVEEIFGSETVYFVSEDLSTIE